MDDTPRSFSGSGDYQSEFKDEHKAEDDTKGESKGEAKSEFARQTNERAFLTMAEFSDDDDVVETKAVEAKAAPVEFKAAAPAPSAEPAPAVDYETFAAAERKRVKEVKKRDEASSTLATEPRIASAAAGGTSSTAAEPSVPSSASSVAAPAARPADTASAAASEARVQAVIAQPWTVEPSVPPLAAQPASASSSASSASSAAHVSAGSAAALRPLPAASQPVYQPAAVPVQPQLPQRPPQSAYSAAGFAQPADPRSQQRPLRWQPPGPAHVDSEAARRVADEHEAFRSRAESLALQRLLAADGDDLADPDYAAADAATRHQQQSQSQSLARWADGEPALDGASDAQIAGLVLSRFAAHEAPAAQRRLFTEQTQPQWRQPPENQQLRFSSSDRLRGDAPWPAASSSAPDHRSLDASFAAAMAPSHVYPHAVYSPPAPARAQAPARASAPLNDSTASAASYQGEPDPRPLLDQELERALQRMRASNREVARSSRNMKKPPSLIGPGGVPLSSSTPARGSSNGSGAVARKPSAARVQQRRADDRLVSGSPAKPVARKASGTAAAAAGGAGAAAAALPVDAHRMLLNESTASRPAAAKALAAEPVLPLSKRSARLLIDQRYDLVCGAVKIMAAASVTAGAQARPHERAVEEALKSTIAEMLQDEQIRELMRAATLKKLGFR